MIDYDEVSSILTRRAISHILNISKKKQGMDESGLKVSSVALETLVDCIKSYLIHVSILTKSSQEHSGRNMASLMDVENAFNLAGINFGLLERFKNLAHTTDLSQKRPLIGLKLEQQNSTVIHDKAMPGRLKAHIVQDLPEKFPKYVPIHMPVYPHKHSYKTSPVYQYREQDLGKVRELSTLQNRRLQDNLKSLIRKTRNTVVDFLHADDTDKFYEELMDKTDSTNGENQKIDFPVINCTR